MKARKYRYFVGDFETTVFKGQQHTEVWASASVELYSEDVKIFNSIEEQYEYFCDLGCNIICYYHNLKFDGSFWLSFLMCELGYKQAYTQSDPDDINTIKFDRPTELENNSFCYSISNMGQWYRITIKHNGKIIEFRDSYKLLPFSVKDIGRSFKTAHQKTDIDYEGVRYAGCYISEKEKEYIRNDVLVVKEALEFMFNEGHDKLTIGSCCLQEYTNMLGKWYYNDYFPDVYQYKLDPEIHGVNNAGDWIRRSYRGGWCYLVKGRARKKIGYGCSADVNSLYPSMMSSDSGNAYPIGQPTFWSGDYIPAEALNNKYYFIRIRTRFRIKYNKLPFVQIKGNLLYKPTESLMTSDVYNYEDGKYYPEYYDLNGDLQPAIVELTLTMTDYILLQEHYHLFDTVILDGCYFDCVVGLFDCYIEKYKKIKVESKGARRTLAKLFLNNLYGKMASSRCSSFKVAFLKEDKSVGFYTVVAHDKDPGYIPVGSAITSYSRNFTIRAAQQNYHGENARGFIYADTDSIHCDLSPDELRGVKMHDSEFCCWKLESEWDTGFFVRQKTYIEHVTSSDGIAVPAFYSVKCAGMPERCKQLFVKSMAGDLTGLEEYDDDEQEFIKTKRELTDFDIGLLVPGKLLPKRIRGGVLLVKTTFRMR